MDKWRKLGTVLNLPGSYSLLELCIDDSSTRAQKNKEASLASVKIMLRSGPGK